MFAIRDVADIGTTADPVRWNRTSIHATDQTTDVVHGPSAPNAGAGPAVSDSETDGSHPKSSSSWQPLILREGEADQHRRSIRKYREVVGPDPGEGLTFGSRHIVSRHSDRTSDLCRVKVSKGSFARLQNRGIAARRLVPLGFSPLVVSRCFSVVFSVVWTRCGRESPLRGSGSQLQQRPRWAFSGFSLDTRLRVASHHPRTLLSSAQAFTVVDRGPARAWRGEPRAVGARRRLWGGPRRVSRLRHPEATLPAHRRHRPR